MRTADASAHLTSNRLLATNALWNLVGQGLPMALALVAVPVLVHRLGADRFGILSLAWVLIGYFGLFDLGIGASLTAIVADRIGTGRQEQIPTMVWTALVFMALLGILGTVVMVMISPWLIHTVLKVPEPLQNESVYAFYLLALSLPLVTTTSGLRGVLEALQRFGTLNAIRTPLTLFGYGGPLLVVPFSRSLVPVIAILVLARGIGCLLHFAACVRALPDLRNGFVFRASALRPVLYRGAWLTVSNIVGPLMVYADRFSIGALTSMTAVAYYSAPAEVVSKITIVPIALVSVLFPAFAVTFARDPSRTRVLLGQGTRHIFVAVFPIVLAAIVFAPEGLNLWLGMSFAEHSTSVMRWLAVGVLISCLSQLPFALVQAGGRPDVTAKIHLIELPLFFFTLRWAIKEYGIEGAAVAWTARVAFDGALMFTVAHRMLQTDKMSVMRSGLSLSAGLATLAAGSCVTGLPAKIAFLCASVGVVLVVWLRGFGTRGALSRFRTAVAVK